MTKYVIQIQIAENGEHVGWLAKSFEVSESCPIPTSWPENREQIIMTNSESFGGVDGIEFNYNKYTTQLSFSHDVEAETISCTGPVEKTWDIN